MVGENLASESNAAKINQRFKEFEVRMTELEKTINTLKNTQANQQVLIQNQNKVIADLYVSKFGNGPTVEE